MSELKILGMSNRMSGCHYHRVTLPLGFMDNIDGLVTDAPNKEIIYQDNYNLLLFNRGCHFQDDWDYLKGKVGIVMDIDDDWNIPANHYMYETYQKALEVIVNNLRYADIVTTTNERLADKIYQYNQNVHVLPNALPYGQDQFTDEKEIDEDGKLRIFWAGGLSHEFDLQILKYPLQRLHSYKDKIKMVMAGYAQNNEFTANTWERMYSSFTDGEKLPGVRMEGLAPRLYMNLYKYGDIMLVPLESSDWHSCKSNIKLLEAGCKGIPCIVSNVEPYSRDIDAPVLWVNNQSDWFKHLKLLINDKDARDEYGQKLKAWATEKYNLAEVNKKRRELFCGVVRNIQQVQSDISGI